MSNQSKRGRYIIIEGVDGSGKSALTVALTRAIRERGEACVAVKQPSFDGPVGVLMRNIFESKESVPEAAMLYLFAADAIEQDVVIREQLSRGISVISDRHTLLSAPAYQSDVHTLKRVFDVQPPELFHSPDLVVFLDCDSQVTIDRREGRARKVTDGKYKSQDIDKLKERTERYMAALAFLRAVRWVRDVEILRSDSGLSSQDLAEEVVKGWRIG